MLCFLFIVITDRDTVLLQRTFNMLGCCYSSWLFVMRPLYKFHYDDDDDDNMLGVL